MSSLFGSSPPGSPSSRLFSDDSGIIRSSSQPVAGGGGGGGGGGLFDDVGDGDIWALPAPRSRSVGPIPGGSVPNGFRGNGGSIVKSLLTESNSNLPRGYVDVWESLAAEFPSGESGVGLEGVRKVFEEAGVDENGEEGRRIREAVVGAGVGTEVGRGEFMVLLAMIGLAQEGEEVSIDGVDDRRRNLPMPKLKTLLPASPYSSRDTERPTPETSAASSALEQSNSQSNSHPTAGMSSAASNSNLNMHVDSTPASAPPVPANVDRSYSTPTANPPQSSNPTAVPRARVVSDGSYTRSLPDPAEQDPWGSPTMHTGHSHAHQNKNNSNPITTPSAVVAGGFGQVAIPQDEHEPDDLQAALRAHSAAAPIGVRQSSAAAWGGYDGAAGSSSAAVTRVGTGMLGGYGTDNGVFGGSGLGSPTAGGVGRMGSFGGLGGGSLGMGVPVTGQQGNQQQQKRPGGGVRFEESVTITVLPEKEGMFLFQYRNYQISSGRRASRVVRRYSDFVWLLDCLHKRYPFRCLPLLPPKRLAVNGHHLSADSTFIENRRRGLIRFTNFLIRHPVLSQEQLVIMFLTVPTELSVWRKQATISVQDEFLSKLQTLTPAQIREIEQPLPPNLEQTFETVRSGLRKSAEIYIGLCALVERLSKRQEGVAGELGRFATALDSLTDVSEATYAIDTTEIPALNEGLGCVGRYLVNAQTLLVDEAKGWEEGLLEDLKRQRDGLVAMREMFDRKERLSTDDVPRLEKRITAAEGKIDAVKARPDPRPHSPPTPASASAATAAANLKEAEIQKLQTQINKDKQAIVDALARRVLIKDCVRDELVTFASSQFHVGRLHQDWALERVKYAELMADNWRGLQQGVDGMLGPE